MKMWKKVSIVFIVSIIFLIGSNVFFYHEYKVLKNYRTEHYKFKIEEGLENTIHRGILNINDCLKFLEDNSRDSLIFKITDLSNTFRFGEMILSQNIDSENKENIFLQYARLFEQSYWHIENRLKEGIQFHLNKDSTGTKMIIKENLQQMKESLQYLKENLDMDIFINSENKTVENETERLIKEILKKESKILKDDDINILEEYRNQFRYYLD
ncbi:hypothetical protein [Dethiothermospora halolimnae]|uniref:hypothetical protein n=1 Tax=Dethiothermospora halolimnae TaxID=3114390 RepID=UPI003CCBAE24